MNSTGNKVEYPTGAYVWERCKFTVPIQTAEETIQRSAPKYYEKAGRALEAQGDTVLGFTPVVPYPASDVPPDRKRYAFYVRVKRTWKERPWINVPDKFIEHFVQDGKFIVKDGLTSKLYPGVSLEKSTDGADTKANR